ncbi:ComEA family DNA-binding protein [Methylolobus aquaticus]
MNALFKFVFIAVAAFTWSFALAEAVDINSANSDQLAQAMVGVGKAKADAIVQEREKNGKFNSIEDLSRVKGIKQALIEKNRNNLTVGAKPVEVAGAAPAK